MTRPYNGHAKEVEFYRRSVRTGSQEAYQSTHTPRNATSGPRLPHGEVRTCPLGRRESRNSPAQESQTETNSNPPRRRIAVACGRCRKRKIKCSGDPGNGAGCQNCRQAGADAQCAFLRVQCEERTLVPDHLRLAGAINCPGAVAWPYGSSDSVSSPSSSIPPFTNSLETAANNSLLSTVSLPVTHASQYQRVPTGNGYIDGQYPPVVTKSSYSTPYGLGYGDGQVEPYTVHPPFMLPSQDLSGVSNAYAAQDTFRAWNPISQQTKVSNNPLFLEGDSSAFPAPPMQYLSSPVSRVSGAPPDGSTFFPTLGPLATSLPGSLAAGDRILPDPALGRPKQPVIPLRSSVPLATTSPSQSFSFRNSCQWGNESVGSSSSQTSSTGVSITAPGRSHLVSSQEPTIAYISSSGSPGPSPHTATSLSYSNTTLPPPIEPPNSYHASISSLLSASSSSSSSSNDAMLGTNATSSNLYSYSSPPHVKSESLHVNSIGEGLLVSGQQCRLPHHHHQTTTLESPRQGSHESGSHSTHRPALSTPNHTAGY
ncbi:hypothetical protein L228DRAFT_259499 [Xylona heveae TC161]|uniref:Zn(2)-C6 fungal-type domain-containing protein n=1 Tax=Xylona heveae (strain CBS 132557 / TC161) TaxID=1328760 RepID=A0A161TPT2_XYLHT|nr:hypothetical protein L228DRAFT_259499 [Xylona heveae TC161]KZF24256.1 hypothetical protein L228DRAFT_259499 [Xylona heveae TC161]